MLDTKLILLDGLPGTGKSSTGRWLIERLARQGMLTEWLGEADVLHPLWWYEFWDGATYQPPDFDHSPVESYIEASLRRWRTFAGQRGASTQVMVVESFLFQNTASIFMMANATPAQLVPYAREVERIIQPLNPALIYFYPDDVGVALCKICKTRGPAFEQELLKNMESFPYLKSRGLTGLAGVATLWRDIRTLTDQLFDALTIVKLAIDISDGDWPNYYRQVSDFLELPPEA